MNKIKKGLLFTLVLLVLGAALSGCFRTGTEIAPTATPAPMVTGMPAEGATFVPGANNAQPGSTMSPMQQFDWAANATTIESRINMFSEIQESSIVTNGTTALVGILFTPQYKGEMTQRIRDMIAGEVMAADPSIQVVAVTAEATDVETIKQLAQQQRSGASQDQLQPEVEKIARNATTLR
jgi:hypothetical protein